jgi:NTE family protein
MEEHHIPVDRIAGTSMGALVGALYATDHSPAQMRALAESNALSSVFQLETPYSDLSYRRRQDRRQDPSAIAVGLRHGVEIRNALFSDRGVNAFITTNLFRYDDGALDYNRLPIPFRSVATDLNTLTSTTFASGPLPQGVRASISIPGVFPPVAGADGHMLVDGGILDNLPTDVVRQDLHADVVLAIHLDTGGPVAGVDTSSMIAVLNRAFSAGIERNVSEALQQANVVVSVPVASYSGLDYNRAAALIEAGYKAAQQSSAALLPYALSPADWQAYLAARHSRDAPAPGVLHTVRAEGGAPGAEQQASRDLQPLVGKPLAAESTLNALKPVQANGGYSAGFSTFDPATQTETPAANTSDTGVLVRLGPDATGPPYLLVGGQMEAATSNVTRMAMNLRLVDQNLGGYGSELRVTAQLGYRTDLAAEYYRQLTPRGLFFEPRTGIVREPVYIWANQKRVAERLQENLVAGAEAGWTIGNTMQISAEWRAQDTHWSLVTGAGGGPYVSGTAQMGLLHINIDCETSDVISPRGFRLSASAGGFYHAVGSANAPVVMLSAAQTLSWSPNNVVGLAVDANSYLRTNVAEPFRFTLGGPRQLAASSFDEYRGTDTGLARVGYLRRLAALPTGLGHGLYSVIGYEAGEVWSPEQRVFLRQDGTAGLVAATPLGAIAVGGAVGDAGHRKVFITLGRLF